MARAATAAAQVAGSAVAMEERAAEGEAQAVEHLAVHVAVMAGDPWAGEEGLKGAATSEEMGSVAVVKTGEAVAVPRAVQVETTAEETRVAEVWAAAVRAAVASAAADAVEIAVALGTPGAVHWEVAAMVVAILVAATSAVGAQVVEA